MRRHPPQLEICFRPRRGRKGFGWGGRRAGAGRKPGPNPGLRHARRPAFAARYPIHVSLKVNKELGNLRNTRCHHAIRQALAACGREGFRVCHYSLQGNHIHLIVEAKDQRTLSHAMQGLMIRMARKLNRVLDRTGKVFADRYFARALKTPTEVRNALAYVLNNHQRHVFGKGPGLRLVGFDRYSSAAAFDGWRLKLPIHGSEPQETVVAEAKTWLLSVGWRRHGLLMPAYVPQWGNSWRARGGVREPRRPK